MKKLFKDLKIGDKLASTGLIVVREPQRGRTTPLGKVEIIFKYPDPSDQKVLKFYGATTSVEIVDNL